jgi:chemotaxis signal transduction protein
MSAIARDPVHALEVPTDNLPLLLPSACMAEVVALSQLAHIPFAPPWLLGVLGWRLRPVPVVSYDILVGGAGQAPGPRTRVVVLYPLPGRKAWEFVGILSSSEPQSRVIDSGVAPTAIEDSYRYIAAALKFDERTVGIPDFAALAKVLYPGR